jgi:uncharacterized membrane protein
MRRAITVLIAGLIVTIVLLPFLTWGLALAGGWNAAALIFVLTTWSIIIRADSSRAPQLAAREDQTEGSARVLLVGASVASLLGAGYALHLAGQNSGAPQMLLIGAAVLTVVLSCAVINTVYTLRYAGQHFRSRPGGIAFGTEDGPQHPGYRDFAYVAFTIGMCYQVSDTTLRDPQIRRTVLAHAIMSYVFGVVIVAGSVNLVNPARPTAPAADTRTFLLPASRPTCGLTQRCPVSSERADASSPPAPSLCISTPGPGQSGMT